MGNPRSDTRCVRKKVPRNGIPENVNWGFLFWTSVCRCFFTDIASIPSTQRISISPTLCTSQKAWQQDPFRQQRVAHENMVELGVAHEAWAPFAEARNNIFENPALLTIAEKHGRTVGQVILRALIQSDVIVIPKTVRRKRMKENFDVFGFALDAEDLAAFATLEYPGFPPIFDHFDLGTVKWLLGDLVRQQQLGGATLY